MVTWNSPSELRPRHFAKLTVAKLSKIVVYICKAQPNPICKAWPLHSWVQSWATTNYRTTWKVPNLSSIVLKEPKQFNFSDSGKMQWPILHWSHPSQRTETELLWNFGVCATVFAKLSWNFHLSLRLQCPCWKPTIYHRFFDILWRYDLFWWLIPGKIAFSLQCSGTKYLYFICAKWCRQHRALLSIISCSAT